MRVAFFSPLPPSRSGIADYSQALLEPLKRHLEIEVFSDGGREFRPEGFDLALYQIGNNPYHDFVYETALRHPGVVVMHESNLHHLIADITIKRGDWDAYLGEAEYNGGAGARSTRGGCSAQGRARLRRRAHDAAPAGIGPGLMVHADFMRCEMRAPGFAGPIARIPHGAWIPEVDRWHIATGWDWTNDAADRHLRVPEALQANCRIAARLPPPGAR